MNNLLKVTKYQLYDFIKPICIFYGVILILGLSVIIVDLTSNGNIEVSGTGITSVIFLSIAGLNAFKSQFKFMQSFNMTRKNFLFGSLMCFIIISFIMAFIDVSLNNFLQNYINYVGTYKSIYNNNNYINDLIWSFSLYLIAINIGFMITIIYYKFDKLMKSIISMIPIFIIIIFAILDNSVNGKLVNFLLEIGNFLMGLTTSSYMAVLSFITGSMLLTGTNYLLIRKMDIKH